MRGRYPRGAQINEADLIKNPYPTYRLLQQEEPITWVEALNMWWVVRYGHVSEILKDDKTFVTESSRSTIFDTFGVQMLSVEGAAHDRYKNGARRAFQPKTIRDELEKKIESFADQLIDAFEGEECAELRRRFASALPIQTMLAVFGLPDSDASLLRRWYDSFEQALANFAGNEQVRGEAKKNVAEFHAHLQLAIDRERQSPSSSLMSRLLDQPNEAKLSDEEVRRNASIILFGGISTVEAQILNALWALFLHPAVLSRVRGEIGLLPSLIDEVIRWQSPVQSATRHVTYDTTFHGHHFRKGDVVNCMLGAANRDPTVFADADTFDIDRPVSPRHLGFAIGPHLCLGLHLARTEARIALERLLVRLPNLRCVSMSSSTPSGYEFRQPVALNVVWDSGFARQTRRPSVPS